MLLLIDGNAVAFRHWVARSGQTSAALPVILLRTLHGWIEQYKPDGVVMAWDSPGAWRRRQAILPTYKAHRLERIQTPSEVEDRARYIKALKMSAAFLYLFGVDQARARGMEADDVIAQIALQTAQRVLIVSTDKDLWSLIGERVHVLDPFRVRLLTARNWGSAVPVPPDVYVDFLALTGDSADGIKGIPGVGPVTAAKWLNEFGSVDGVMARATKPPKPLASLRAAPEVVERNRKLIDLTWAASAPPVTILHGRWDEDAAYAACESLLAREVMASWSIYEADFNCLAARHPQVAVGR